jgi:hypothetical protein
MVSNSQVQDYFSSNAIHILLDGVWSFSSYAEDRLTIGTTASFGGHATHSARTKAALIQFYFSFKLFQLNHLMVINSPAIIAVIFIDLVAIDHHPASPT